MAVKEDSTIDSLQNFIEEIIENCDGEFPFHDVSGIEHVPDDIKEKYFPDAATFECGGGGRCFEKGMKFDIVIDKEMIDLIDKYEK